MLIAGERSGALAKPTQGPVASLTASLPAPARGALASIAEGGRRLLALRVYLRSEKGLEQRWSWTEKEIEDYVQSPEYATALADIDKVRKAFEEANDGYSLKVNTNVRSLDDQIDSWNRNASVGRVASKLGDDFNKWLGAKPDATSADAKDFLSNWQPSGSVPLAVPGLSRHGRARAFDFQIQKGGGIVAGAGTGAVKEVWDKGGWTEKLKAAVTASEAPFDGPLETPAEPWHYDYEPASFPTGKETGRAAATTVMPASDAPPPIPRPRVGLVPIEPALSSMQKAEDAYSRGDYALAIQLWLPLAEKGDFTAQSSLASMYRYGHGVPQSDEQFLKWYRLASAQWRQEPWWLVAPEDNEPRQLAFTGCDPDAKPTRVCVAFRLSCDGLTVVSDALNYIIAKRLIGSEIYDGKKMTFTVASTEVPLSLRGVSVSANDMNSEWDMTVEYSEGSKIFDAMRGLPAPVPLALKIAGEEFDLTPREDNWSVLTEFASDCTECLSSGDCANAPR